jgi:hypothetical protein
MTRIVIVILIEDDQHYQQTVIKSGWALAIDIGGNKTDWLAVNPVEDPCLL